MKKITHFMLIVFTTITLQGQNKLLSSIDESYNGSSWEKYAGTNYEYDSNNNLITESYNNYDSGTSSWKLSYKTSYTYNASNKVTLSIDQDWNTTTNMLVNSYKSTMSYINGMYAGETGEIWDSFSSSWVNEWKNTVSYNSNNLPETALFYNWVGSQWVLDSRSTVTYNGNNKVISVLGESWKNSQWVNLNKEILTYDANNKIITDRFAEWDDFNNLFKENQRTDYTLDATGNRSSEINSWTDLTTNVTSKYKQEYTYDTSSLMSSFANPFKDKTGIDYLFYDFPHINKALGYNFSNYDTATSTFSISQRTNYDYNNSITLGTEKFETANATITVFPNPTQDFLSIQTSLNTDIDKIIVTELSGKIVVQQNQKGNQVNVQNLAKGMYLLQVFSGDNKWNSKFLKD